MKQKWAIAIVVVLLLLLLVAGPEVISVVTNGSVVGPKTTLGADGIIWTLPSELAEAAGLDYDVYALSRCGASEHPNDPDVYLRAVLWAVRNKAFERGVSVLEQLTDGQGERGDGYFGEQKAAAGTKYASTALDPHDRHVRIAGEVMNDATPDPTGGATHFYSPQAQDQLAAQAAAGDARFAKYLGKDAAFIDASWRAPGGLYASGAEPVVPAGVDPRRLTLYRRLG
jgi:hypothetical protein